MNKKAMAIEIVLIFATIMGIVGLFLLKTTRSNYTQLETSMCQLQSYFIARAGVEHAMLKIKLLNKEFYDAICMYQGRSPLFNYNGLDTSNLRNNICATNPGPIFLFTSDESGSLSTNGVFTDMSTGPYSTIYNKWVNVFKEDIYSDYKEANTFLTMNPLPDNIKKVMAPVDSVTGNSDGVFAGFNQAYYQLTDMDFGAQEIIQEKSVSEKNAIFVNNTIAVNFTIKSIYKSPKDQDYNYEIKRTVTVSRESKL